MITPPGLAFQPDSILEDEDALAVQTVQDRLGQLASGGQDRQPGQGLQLSRKGLSRVFEGFGGAEPGVFRALP
jgi:hypothetical protein